MQQRQGGISLQQSGTDQPGFKPDYYIYASNKLCQLGTRHGSYFDLGGYGRQPTQGTGLGQIGNDTDLSGSFAPEYFDVNGFHFTSKYMPGEYWQSNNQNYPPDNKIDTAYMPTFHQQLAGSAVGPDLFWSSLNKDDVVQGGSPQGPPQGAGGPSSFVESLNAIPTDLTGSTPVASTFPLSNCNQFEVVRDITSQNWFNKQQYFAQNVGPQFNVQPKFGGYPTYIQAVCTGPTRLVSTGDPNLVKVASMQAMASDSCGTGGDPTLSIRTVT
jgi:hypothetical protein